MNIAQLASQLKSTQAALILSEENRLYFTGFPSSNGTLLVMPEESAFVTDSRYFEAASNTVTEAQVLLQDQVYQQVFDLLQKHSCTEILVESERMTLSELNKWRKMLPTYSFNVSNRLDTLANELREVKCEAEVEKMQRAQDIAEKALEELLHILKPGVAERDLANELEYLMRKFGADGISFDTIVVSGANSSKPHGVPGEKLVETGDFVARNSSRPATSSRSISGRSTTTTIRTAPARLPSAGRRRRWSTSTRPSNGHSRQVSTM